MLFKLEQAINNNDLPGQNEYIRVLEREIASQDDNKAINEVRSIAASKASDVLKLEAIEYVIDKY